MHSTTPSSHTLLDFGVEDAAEDFTDDQPEQDRVLV
jgi:hypothetical protein